MSKNIPPLAGQVYEIIPNIDSYQPGEEVHNTERVVTEDVDQATVITSRIAGSEKHKIVIDLDLPAQLIPSTTPGHFHLYVDHEVDWMTYVNLLQALAKARLVEQGYVDVSIFRGHTAARLPWVKKVSPPEVEELPEAVFGKPIDLLEAAK
jgi:hypothetical protein